MKKVLSIIILLSSILSFMPKSTFANDDNYFVVTAYYSPLPNQKHYLKGNYEDEKILNGQGIAGASGKPVFSGMLAAPGKYKFGTKIYLEGVGVGVVEDRGGAIVPAGQRGYGHDRIDIWVGYGDEGLRRALYWGKRKIKGSVISNNSAVTLDYSKIPAPLWATNGLKKVSNVFHTPLGKGSSTTQVSELQKVLKEVGLYKGEIDGIYNVEVIDIVYDFQVENGIMKNEYSYGAGYWGATTRNLFFKKYISGGFSKEKTPEEMTAEHLEIFDTPLKSKDTTITLQNILTEIAIYEGDINGDYSSLQPHILNYQLENNIVVSENSIGAGVFGPKTRASLKSKYELYLEEKKRQVELEKIYTELEEASFELATEIITTIGSPKYGEISSQVRLLQIELNKLGYADFKDTAIFGVKTKNSIIAFQTDMGLIENPSNIGAGVFGPKTKVAFEDEIKNHILQEKLIEADIFEEIELLKKDNLEEQDISAVGTSHIQTI